jgi:hypothetical protein
MITDKDKIIAVNAFSPYDARTARACIKAAKKRMPFASEKKQNEILGYSAGSLAEAYRIGAEEAQGEIVSRLATLVIGGRK